MTSIDHVLIVIPAHNEQRRISRALAAVSVARSALPFSISSSVVVAADSCTDNTWAAARRMMGASDLVLETRHRSAGRARRTATAAGLEKISFVSQRVWIANTDADSVVAPDWLTMQVRLANEGARAVAGVVSLAADECDPDLFHRFQRAYLIHHDGTHPHVHGTNLGVRADAYFSVGGWPRIKTGEDQTLWRRLRAAGHPTVSTSSLVVQTSARLRGRAPDGFAKDLANLASRAAA